MKVLAVKDVEERGNLWAVPYTYLRADGRKRGGMFFYDTPEEAKEKYQELLDVLEHHDGVYLGKKAKMKLRTSSGKLGGGAEMAWRINNLSVVIGTGQSQRWTFSWGGADMGAQYFVAHPLIVGNELQLSAQTKATVPAIGGGIFYAVTVTNVSPRPGQFTWEGGGFT